MEHKPKRRWLTFGVRTLMIAVTVLSIWLGLQVKLVRDRKAMLDRIDDAGGLGNWIGKPPARKVPWLRQQLGDQFIPQIEVPGDWTVEQIDEVRELFLESRIEA